MINLILCGGSGTRLWPVSRTLYPKQFTKLLGEQSLFQQSVLRNQAVCSQYAIVSNAEQYFLALDQLEEIKQTEAQFLLEPMGRNTAPAIALACLQLQPDDIVLVTPCDHLIQDWTRYQNTINHARAAAAEGVLVVFGVHPTHAETGFGYIECDLTAMATAPSVHKVCQFHEKPDLSTAKQYCSSKRHFWNAGIFCFRVDVFLSELKQYAPDIYQACLSAHHNQIGTQNLVRIRHQDMQTIPANSIDYAVLEKSSRVHMIAADFDWSDIGSFDALYQELPKNDAQNTLSDHHISINSHNNLIHTQQRLVATIDIDDCLIIDSGDALLVAKKGSAQKVKQLMPLLQAKHSELMHSHATVHRPWGSYTILETTPGYKIKRIEVKPGKRLSLQKHFHRNEHWIVVSGSATVTVGTESFLLRPNESTYIPMGQMHRLANEGKIPVILIEAQVGEYTEEDDIVRFDDDFERA